MVMSPSKMHQIPRKRRFWLFRFLIFILTLFNACTLTPCRPKNQVEESGDYAIDFFRKTGKYPSTGFLESNGMYGTPLILKSQDSALWIIIFGMCLGAFLIGIGIILVGNFLRDADSQDKGPKSDRLDSEDFFYEPLESSEEEFRRLKELQNKFVNTINPPAPNAFVGYYQNPGCSQFPQLGNYISNPNVQPPNGGNFYYWQYRS
ncbi:hypothetical protein HWI79_3364 [Cryptosporidium felis]|nr:hypothetical protein HWI79_3364 [Cryptosporidium felis]